MTHSTYETLTMLKYKMVLNNIYFTVIIYYCLLVHLFHIFMLLNNLRKTFYVMIILHFRVLAFAALIFPNLISFSFSFCCFSLYTTEQHFSSLVLSFTCLEILMCFRGFTKLTSVIIKLLTRHFD